MRLLKEYQAITDAIVMLRAFRAEGAVEYELVEIHTTMFAAVETLSIEDAQKSTIPIPDRVVPLFRIRVDRSDAKTTLTAIRLDACTVHGEWKLDGERR